MIINVFTVHDSKAQAYLPPFNLPTKEMAVRTFSDTVNDSKHPFGKHPADYTLFHIGTFDDDTGLITNNQDNGKECLGNGVDVLLPQEKQFDLLGE